MNTFEIIIQRKSGENWPMIAEYSRAGVLLPSRAEGTLALGPEDFQALISLLGQPKAYGTRLGEALFRDKLRDAFVGALRESEDQLRVLLCVEDNDSQAATQSLKTLRWERLCAPIDAGWELLALNQRTPFSLYIPSTTDRRFPPIGRRDLRALVLVASPTGSERFHLEPFDVEATVASVGSALGAIPYDVLAPVADAIGPPTLDELCRQLTDRRKQYTLLHVVCHGKLIAGGETVVYWANADNQVQPVTGTALLERLGQLRGPRGLPHFAFLSTCESASPEAEGALGGLAQRLVRELGMPAVVAMTERVTMKTAQALADSFYRRLHDSGEVDVALPEATAGLGHRADITVPALFSRLGGRPLFSDQLDRDLTNAEIAAGLKDLCTFLDARAPVLREAFDQQAATLRGTLGADATALSKATRQEREAALEEVNNLAEEALDLSFNALALGQQPSPYDSRCPFRGLYPFRVEDREFFFGREVLIKHLCQKLAEHNFLAVLGPSGSGKSSVILAGLIPALQQDNPGLQMAYLTPGNDPLANLEASLAKVPDPMAVLVVDQFEELFTLCTDEARRIAFISHVLTLAQQRRVIITLRADFWGECAPYRDLKALMQDRQELIAPMDAAELRKAMEGQAGQVKLRFEAGLTNRILDNVQDEPGAMPLLQHALLKLWEKRHGRWLRTTEYEAIGGIKKAIAQTADAFYGSLSPTDRAHMENIFVRLTRLDADAVQSEKQQGTRRRVGLEELVPARGDPAATKRLVQRLAGEEARLLVTRVNGATQREEVEVAHEALIRYWPRLQSWLKQNRADLLLRDKIRQEAFEWVQHQREESEERLVLRGGQLEDAAALPLKRPGFLNELESAYVNACLEWRQHLRRQEEERLKRELEASQKLTKESEARREADAKARQEAELRVEQEATARKTVQTRNKILAGLLVATLCAIFWAIYQWRKAEIGQIQALSESSKAKFTSNQSSFDALLDALKAGTRLKQLFWSNGETQLKADVMTALTESVFWVKEKNRLEGHTAVVNNLSFSPDGQTIASASGDETIKLWQRDGGIIDTLTGHIGRVTSVSFSHDGQSLASCSHDGAVRLWKKKDSKWHEDKIWRKTLSDSKEAVKICVVSFNRNHELLAGGDDGTVRVWQLNGNETASLTGDKEKVLSFSLDGKIIATTSRDHTIKLWQRDGGIIDTLIGHADLVTSASFSHDGQILVSGSLDGTIRLWQLNGDLTTPITTLTSDNCDENNKDVCGVRSVSVSPDGETIASGGQDNTVKLWQQDGDWKKKKLPMTLTGHSNYVVSVSFSEDGKILGSASNDNTIKLWNLKNPWLTVLNNDTPTRSVSFSPNGLILATGNSNTVKFWGLDGLLRDSIVVKGVEENEHKYTITINNVTFSQDGQLLASASSYNKDEKGQINIWQINGNGMPPSALISPRGNADFLDVSFSPNNSMIATANRAGNVQLWRRDGTPITQPTLEGHEPRIAYGVRFSNSTGQMLASSGGDGIVNLWKIDDLWKAVTRIASLQEPEENVFNFYEVSFSPDDRMIAGASKDGSVKLWKIDGGEVKLVNCLKQNSSPVTAVSFNPKKRYLVSANERGEIFLWKLDGTLISKLTGHSKYVLSLSFTPDGKTLGSGSDDKTTILWNLEDPSDDGLSLDHWLTLGCSWIQDYLKTNPTAENTEDHHHLCK